MLLRRRPWAFPRSPGPATPAKGACPCNQPATTRATATDGGPVIASVLIAVAFAVPLLILGLVAPIRGRPQDMPAIMYALARGAEAELALGGPAIVVAAESVQAGGQGSNRNPLPAGHRAYYNDRPGSLKISAGTWPGPSGDPSVQAERGVVVGQAADPVWSRDISGRPLLSSFNALNASNLITQQWWQEGRALVRAHAGAEPVGWPDCG
jgi:hypothetical protein